MASSPSKSVILLALVVVTLLCPLSTSWTLSPDYYKNSCPYVLDVVRPVLSSAIAKENRIGASIVRLFFHDCFVNGCDASLLLDDKDGIVGEKLAGPNRNSARGFEVVDAIKTAVEKACPGVVSCADVLAIAASESVAILGGPQINTKLGRRDARTANQTDANVKLPGPTSSLQNLIQSFRVVGLNEKDVVALSGAHTIGLARCTTFRDHIYGGTNIDPSFAALRQSTCPRPSGTGDNNLAPLDLQTPTVFDNDYFKNLVQRRGLLNSDQVLFNAGSADALVLKYSQDKAAFFTDFVESMIRMGDIWPARGTPLEVRKNCRRVNM